MLGSTSSGGRTIDGITSVAFAVRGRPGAYAVLLGSGVSTGAGVPTGWQIVERLVLELARAAGEDPGSNALAWYTKRFGDQPTYSGLVAALGLTAAERQALIASFLHTDGASRPPAPAHRALGRLVAGGWIRVILTTNFDRLIETALVEAGVSPTVLASPEAVSGALPLVHVGPVVVKLHGDQNDPRILNTDVELDSYPPPVEALLDRVFDEYGLIVAGWSGDHDTALRRALERASSRRFTTFWIARRGIEGEAARVAALRQAEVLDHIDADTFFGRLADACEALAATAHPHPYSVATDVAVAKRELSGAHVAISLHDRIRSEVERVAYLEFLSPDPRAAGDDQLQVVERAVGEAERLVALIATAAHWGAPRTDRWWTADIARMARRPLLSGSINVLDRPRVPALLIAWAAGTAGVAAGRDDLLETLFSLEDVPDPGRNDRIPAVLAAAPEVLHTMDDIPRLYRALRPAFADYLAIGRDAFVEAWERWQYLLLLASYDLRERRNIWVYVPSSGIRVDGYKPVLPVPYRWALLHVDRLGENHPLLRAGYFGGSRDALIGAIEATAEAMASSAEQADWRLIAPAGAGMLPSGRHYPGHYSEDPDTVFRLIG